MEKNNLTPKQQEFIDDLLAKMGKQSNRMTQFPLFYVHEKKYVYNENDDGRPVYMDSEGDWQETTEYTIEEDGTVWKLNENNDMWVLDHMDNGDEIPESFEEREIEGYDFVDRDGVTLRRGHMKEEDVTVVNAGPFFTEEAAQEHIDANYYHYNQPYIYVWSCWRNYEMQEVMKILFTLAGKEIPTWYK